MRIVAVTGGRDFRNRKLVFEMLSSLHKISKIDVLVHGGCTGADSLCMLWARAALVQTAEFAITEDQWNALGRKCGPQRNRMMLEVTRPNTLVAFPGGIGTKNCVGIARKLGIEILKVLP